MDNQFTSKFALKNLFFYKNKVFLVLIGFIFSLGLLNSVFIWADTSERMVITKFTENNDYMFSSTSFLQRDTFFVSDYFKTDNLVKSSDLSIRSEVLFNTENKVSTYRFFPLDDQETPNDPIVTGNSITTNMTAFAKLDHLFELEGFIPVQKNEILINDKLLEKLNTNLNTSYGVGSHINLSISRNFPETDAGEHTLKGFQKKDYTDIVISGVVRYKELQSMMDKVYSESAFSSFVLFPVENFQDEDLDLMNHNGIRIYSMITFKMKYLFEFGINRLIELLLTLSEKIKTRYYSAITTLLTQPIKDLIQEFNFSFNSIYLYLPLISLALLLSNFAATILLQNREDDIKMLRERGATNLDLTRLFAYEFMIIAVLGILIGFPVSVLLSILIPNITPSGRINLDNTELFAQNLQLDPSSVILTIITVLGIFLISVSYQVHLMVFRNDRTQHINPNQINYIKIGKLVLTLLLTLELINLLNNISSGLTIQEFQLNVEAQLQLRLMIFIFNIVFVLISQYLSNLVLLILKSLNTVIYRVLPSVSYLVNKNFTRKQNNVSTLSFFLIFLMAVLALSSTLDSTYQRNDERAAAFLQGSELRIHTEGTSDSFAEVLRQIPGVKYISPIYSSNARIVSTEITVYAVDIDNFIEVGRWEDAQGQGSPKETVAELNNYEDGILISSRVSKRLGHKVGGNIFINGYEGAFVRDFTVAGIIDSAPALGLSGYSNPELDQDNNGWAMISLDYLKQISNISSTELFLGSFEENVNQQKVIDNISQLGEVIVVNPVPITDNFISVNIAPFLPSPSAILLFVKSVSVMFSIFFISIITESILRTRKKENAILIAIGVTKKQLSTVIFGEFSLTIIISTIIGIILGLILSLFALYFFLPFTVKRIFINIDFIINFAELLFLLALISITALTVIIIKINQLHNEIPFDMIIGNR